VINRYVGNLAPMTGVFPDYLAPVVRNTDTGRELAMMRWGDDVLKIVMRGADKEDNGAQKADRTQSPWIV
jgi:hypothetical protein